LGSTGPHAAWVKLMDPSQGPTQTTELRVFKSTLEFRGLGNASAILGVSPQSLALTMKKALKNVELAEETVVFYKLVSSRVRILVKPKTSLSRIPKVVLEEADIAGVKVRADYSLIYRLVEYEAGECISDGLVTKPILVLIDREGFIDVYPYERVASIASKLERILGELPQLKTPPLHFKLYRDM